MTLTDFARRLFEPPSDTSEPESEVAVIEEQAMLSGPELLDAIDANWAAFRAQLAQDLRFSVALSYASPRVGIGIAVDTLDPVQSFSVTTS